MLRKLFLSSLVLFGALGSLPRALAGGPRLGLEARQGPELERRIEASFRRLLGQPKHLRVELESASVVRRLGGSFDRIRVSFEDGMLDELKVAEATLLAEDVQFDLPSLFDGSEYRPRRVGSTRIDLRITEEDLNQIIQSKRSQVGVQNPEFSLEDGRIRFRGRIKLFFFQNQVDLAGGLKVRDGLELDFTPASVAVSQVRLPGFLVSSLSRRFNPILKLDRAEWVRDFALKLDRVDISPKSLRISSDPAPRPVPLPKENPVPLFAEKKDPLKPRPKAGKWKQFASEPKPVRDPSLPALLRLSGSPRLAEGL